MKRIFIYMIVLLCLLFTGCRNGLRHTEVLSEATRLSDSIPSQALMKLEEIKDVKRLNASEQAEYNLIFIKSMLRSGNKLPSDSIIHTTTQYYRNHNDSAGLHQALYYNGLYHYRNAMHDSAVLYFDKAIKAVPAGNDKDRKAGYKRTAGYSYLYLGDAEAAVKTQKEGLQYARATNDSLSVIYSLLSLADAYKYNKETEQSLETYMQALDRVREREERDMEADILNIVSGIYESDNRIKEALSYKNKSQEIKRNRQDIPAVNLQRAILFGKQNMPDSARHYAQLSIKGDDQFVADLAYALLSISEAKEGRYTDALNLSKNSERIFNSFLSGVRSAEMQQKYEKEKLENENNQLKIKQKEHQFYLLVSAFLLLLMLIVLYVIRVNSRRKNEKAAHENRMLRLQQENLLLKQQQEISALREKEAVLRESLFRKINFFNKLPSLNREEHNHHDKQGKIKITPNDWQELISGIRDAYPEFLDKLKQHAPTLSDDDIRFCCLLKINVNMQDLSDIYCVSKAAITKRKYRLKTEKFHIVDNNVNLDALLQQMY
ncbi:hypothetical protein [uncultured Proteiniphilum sp.]|uniref:tetratricopeptide repeat protein n=1 Tax=uncultured Proteiniphilum sp. TaxID=497637 RepID=UPI00260F9E20|nr:hypothetical protein [uncultured Proteiniphilum sp.]